MAKDIGIDVEDGHPILDKMVELDSARIGDMISKCSHVGCSSKAVEASLCSQNNGESLDNRINTPKKDDQNGNPDQSKDD